MGHLGWQPYILIIPPLTRHGAASPPQDKGQGRNQLQVLNCLCDHSLGSSTQGPIFTPHTASDVGKCPPWGRDTKAQRQVTHLSSARSLSWAQEEQPTGLLPRQITSSVTPCLPALLVAGQDLLKRCRFQKETRQTSSNLSYTPRKPESWGEVCCLHVPATATSTKQQVRAELQST